MKIIQDSTRHSVLRFMRGEEFLEEFQKFLAERGIAGGFFAGLGAMENPTVSYYDIETKSYISKSFPGVHEVTSCSGNIARTDGDIFIHCHCSFADVSYKMFGGHLMGGVVGATLEVYLSQTGDLRRERDDAIGLSLLV